MQGELFYNLVSDLLLTHEKSTEHNKRLCSSFVLRCLQIQLRKKDQLVSTIFLWI